MKYQERDAGRVGSGYKSWREERERQTEKGKDRRGTQADNEKALPAVSAPGVQHVVALFQVMLKSQLQTLIEVIPTGLDLRVLPRQAFALVGVHYRQTDSTLQSATRLLGCTAIRQALAVAAAGVRCKLCRHCCLGTLQSDQHLLLLDKTAITQTVHCNQTLADVGVRCNQILLCNQTRAVVGVRCKE